MSIDVVPTYEHSSKLGSVIVVKGAVGYAIMICVRFNIVPIDASLLRKHYFSGMQVP